MKGQHGHVSPFRGLRHSPEILKRLQILGQHLDQAPVIRLYER